MIAITESSLTLPVLVKGGISKWAALDKWTWEYFSNMKSVRVQLSTSTCDNAATMKMKEYIKFIHVPSNIIGPLHTASWRFFETHPEMMFDFVEPDLASKDIFQNIPKNIFNPMLWLFIGGRRTNTPMHQDALLTHAWLAVIIGKKKIVLHSPAAHLQMPKEQPIAKRSLAEGRPYGNWLYYEINRGDILYIPSGWWHEVVNDAPTLCLTRNFTTPSIAPLVARAAYELKLTKLLTWLPYEQKRL